MVVLQAADQGKVYVHKGLLNGEVGAPWELEGLVSPELQLRVLLNTPTRATRLPQQHQLLVQVPLSALRLLHQELVGVLLIRRLAEVLAAEARKEVRKTYYAVL